MPSLEGLSSTSTIILLIYLIPWQDAERYDPAAREAEEKEMETLFRKVNRKALAARASHLWGGIHCAIPALQHNRTKQSSIMGGMNYHVEIVFEDGVVWLARIRRFNATSPPSLYETTFSRANLPR